MTSALVHHPSHLCRCGICRRVLMRGAFGVLLCVPMRDIGSKYESTVPELRDRSGLYCRIRSNTITVGVAHKVCSRAFDTFCDKHTSSLTRCFFVCEYHESTTEGRARTSRKQIIPWQRCAPLHPLLHRNLLGLQLFFRRHRRNSPNRRRWPRFSLQQERRHS
jgi:hypothetical protein